jgi:hypothetical protein
MITEKDLLDAIRECEAEPITAQKVGKLADFYIIYDHLFGKPYDNMYSGAEAVEETIWTNGGSEFLQTINGKKADRVWLIMDELMEATKMLHPRMYDGVLRKIHEN